MRRPHLALEVCTGLIRTCHSPNRVAAGVFELDACARSLWQRSAPDLGTGCFEESICHKLQDETDGGEHGGYPPRPTAPLGVAAPESEEARRARAAAHEYINLRQVMDRISAKMAKLASRFSLQLSADGGGGSGSAAVGIHAARHAPLCSPEHPMLPLERVWDTTPTADRGCKRAPLPEWSASSADLDADASSERPTKRQTVDQLAVHPRQLATSDAAQHRGDDGLPQGAARSCCMHMIREQTTAIADARQISQVTWGVTRARACMVARQGPPGPLAGSQNSSPVPALVGLAPLRSRMVVTCIMTSHIYIYIVT